MCRIGCDACGMYPIVGPRWKCQQCNEAVGFDMCGDCHSRKLHIIGRFNQQHNAGTPPLLQDQAPAASSAAGVRFNSTGFRM